jgi:hypothetical protein
MVLYRRLDGFTHEKGGLIMFQRIKDFFLKKYLASFVRTVMAAVGGFLAGLGLIPAEVLEKWVESTTALVIGLAMYLITQGLSLKDKSDNQP